MIAIRAAGDAALLMETGQLAIDNDHGNGPVELAAAIRSAPLPGLADVVPGAATVLVTVEPGSWALADLAARLRQLASAAAASPPPPRSAVLVLDTVYDGPDLADVAALTGLSTGEVIARHAAAEYRVGWLGFSPGFGYLNGLDPLLAAVPRLDTPRLSVRAGSVAIGGGLAAIYPAASPGGWRLLGRTAAALWDAGRNPPALLSPGQRIRFRPADQLRAAASVPEVAAAPGSPPQAAPAGPQHAARARLIRVIQPGPLATVQDLGRIGLAHLGVPGSGAADAASLRRANRLVGNDETAAGLEATLGRLVVRFEADAVAAVTGAPVPLTLEPDPYGGEPAHDTRFEVRAGSALKLGSPRAGLRSYLAVDGGIEVPPVLGSRSTDRLSGLGPAPLRAGDLLPLGPPRSLPGKPRDTRPRAVPSAAVPAGGAQAVQLRAIAGPRHDWFTAAALTALQGGGYQVTAASDRTGLRLAGPVLTRAPGRTGELASEGTAAGSLQVTHDGQLILLLADHPVTGGYPVIAVVVSADLGLAAQLRPGQRIRFAVRVADLG